MGVLTEVTTLNMVVWVCLSMQMTFKQRLEGSKGEIVSQGGKWILQRS